jgi:hypothetical protein
MCCELLVGLQGDRAMDADAYLVKCQHLTNKLSAVLHRSTHLVVDLIFL